MSKKCARCEKTVYPIEELKCLDKVWHKGCFKCQECGMTLSMKTYKGLNKLPYCEAHIPKAKATAVAETPEMKRLAENTKIQSNVQYHADFEKNKAKFTQVADDPETMRIKQNTKIISNVSYHGDLEKKAIMEKKRNDPTIEEEPQVAPVPIEDHHYPSAAELPHQGIPSNHYQSQKAPPHGNPTLHSQSQPVHNPPQVVHQSHQGPHQNQPFHQQNHNHDQVPGHSMHSQQQAYRGVMAQPMKQPGPPQQHSQYYQPQQVAPNAQPYYPNNMSIKGYHHHPQQNVYQDANHNSPYSARNSQTLIYSSQSGGAVQQQSGNKRVGSIADYDPINDQYGSIAPQKRNQAPSGGGGGGGGYRQEATYQVQRSNMSSDIQAMQQSSQPPMQHKINAPPTHLGRCFRAMYDYEAADTDEVSFRDGDLLINCTSIDEGWMTGTVQRTGRAGMLPANYVERAS